MDLEKTCLHSGWADIGTVTLAPNSAAATFVAYSSSKLSSLARMSKQMITLWMSFTIVAPNPILLT